MTVIAVILQYSLVYSYSWRLSSQLFNARAVYSNRLALECTLLCVARIKDSTKTKRGEMNIMNYTRMKSYPDVIF